jgi:hypothetical protein
VCAAQRSVCFGTAHPHKPASAFWDCAHRSPPDWAHTRPHLHRDQLHPPTNHTHCVATTCTVASECHLGCNRVPPVSDPAADGTRCNRLHAAALPCHWLHPIQASEAKAPLAESRGVCAALWTRIGSDVSEAVRLAAPSIPAAGRARATGSQDSVDVRVAGFGSEQPRPTPTLCLGLRLGLWVGQRTRAQHGPTAFRWWPRREMGHRCPPRWNLACCWGGLPGLAVPLVRRAAAWRGGSCRIRGRFARWAWRPAGGEAGAQDGGASRCQFGQAPTVEVGPSGRLVSRRGS